MNCQPTLFLLLKLYKMDADEIFAAMGITGFGKAAPKRELDPNRFDKTKRDPVSHSLFIITLSLTSGRGETLQAAPRHQVPLLQPIFHPVRLLRPPLNPVLSRLPVRIRMVRSLSMTLRTTTTYTTPTSQPLMNLL